jgi:hypothetical protein
VATRDGVSESPAPGLPSPENLDGMEPPATRPVDYGALNAAYAALLAGLVATQGRRSEEERIAHTELVPIGAAAFALSKIIARERIGTWLREPFVEEGFGRNRLRGRRLRRAIGELVTCTRCVGAWSSLGIVGLRLTYPRTGRIITTVLATSAVNDFLQATFKALCEASNALEAGRAARPLSE